MNDREFPPWIVPGERPTRKFSETVVTIVAWVSVGLVVVAAWSALAAIAWVLWHVTWGSS